MRFKNQPATDCAAREVRSSKAKNESVVFDWFSSKYGEPTPAQREAWPKIANGKNVLIASPTGTGKTFAAFLSVLDALARESQIAKLRDTFYCLYISPLRALAYDLEKNLNDPLREIFGSLENSPIRVAMRSGDTSGAARAKQFSRPPHILLTTPESLCVLLSQPRWLPHLASVRWIIVDEIHALAENKRGAHLSLSLERLSAIISGRVGVSPAGSGVSPERTSQDNKSISSGAPQESSFRQDAETGGRDAHPTRDKSDAFSNSISISLPRPVQRIGLSATVAPLDEVARFLVGTKNDCEIVDVSSAKKIDLRVHTPLRKNPYPQAGYSGQRMIHELAELIEKNRTTLVFTNTRSGAEAATYWLRETVPQLANVIECHHASLDRDVRQDVEDRLKRGELRAVVCSTSLELGIDIGSIDLVVMLATPKGVSKALQRTGRSGHNIHTISRGVLMATNVNDLVEACATALLARERNLDPVRIPTAPLDILAQHLVSMGCAGFWLKNEAFTLVTQAFPYRNLPRADFDDVLDYLAGGGKSLRQQYTDVFGKIDLDDDGFQTKPGRVQRDFLQNIGVIPETGVVNVRLKNRSLGSVEEMFIRQLKPGDVFVIAGRPVRLERAEQMIAFVTRADGELPTIPRWNANKMPLSTNVARELIRFRSELREKMQRENFEARDAQNFEKHASAGIERWIAKRLECGAANARIISKMYSAQARLSEIPTADFLLIEEYLETEMPQPIRRAVRTRGATNRAPTLARPRHYFFHSLIGRAANDALSRVIAWRMNKLRGRDARGKNSSGGNALATPHDYGFVLTVSEHQFFTAEDLPELLAAEDFLEQFQRVIEGSEMLKFLFRNAAQTGLMVYRNYFSERKPLRKIQWSSEVIFNVLQKYEPDHVLLREARRDSMHTFLDAEGALRFLEKLTRGNSTISASAMPVRLREVQHVPPLSFAMYATKMRETLMVEDPTETMERLFNLWWREIETEV